MTSKKNEDTASADHTPRRDRQHSTEEEPCNLSITSAIYAYRGTEHTLEIYYIIKDISKFRTLHI